MLAILVPCYKKVMLAILVLFPSRTRTPSAAEARVTSTPTRRTRTTRTTSPVVQFLLVGDAGDPGPMLQEGDAGDPGPLSGERGGDSRHHELSERVPQYILETEDTEALQIRQHRLREERGKRPIFVEIYAGKGLLGKMMEAQGYETISIDLPHWDLDKKDCRLQLLQLVVDLEPEIVWCAPACTLWSSLQNLNVKNAQDFAVLDDARCRHHRTHLSMVAKIYDIQRRGGRLAVVEHPKGSLAWQSKAFESLQGHTVMLDMCAYGATGTTPDGGNELYQETNPATDDQSSTCRTPLEEVHQGPSTRSFVGNPARRRAPSTFCCSLPGRLL